MKVLFALIVAIGVAVVAGELQEELQMALKELLDTEEMLEMQSRDTLGTCMSTTNNCNGFGQCVQGRWGGYYCRCNPGAIVSGPQSTCIALTSREETPEASLEMQARDSVARCNLDTNNCNDNGKCQQSVFNTYKFICVCDPGYKNDVSGSCVAQTKREMALLDMSLRDSLMLCQSDTNNCNGYGECLEGRYGWRCICNDATKYTIDANGSCVPIVSNQSRSAELFKRMMEALKIEEEK